MKYDALTLPERGRRITDSFACIPNRAVELTVPILGTAKIGYMRGFRLFAMYVRTEPVHTYIAKSPKRAIYTILYYTELVWVILTQTTMIKFEYLAPQSNKMVLCGLRFLSIPTNPSWLQKSGADQIDPHQNLKGDSRYARHLYD